MPAPTPPYRLFIDDLRDVHSSIEDEGWRRRAHLSRAVDRAHLGEWVVARSHTEAVAIMMERGSPAFVSFDHDLGEEEDAIVTAHFMVQRDLDVPGWLHEDFEFEVHSSNPGGRTNIVGLLENYLADRALTVPRPDIVILSYSEALERYREFDAVVSIENPNFGRRLRYGADGGPEQLVLAFDDVDHDHGLDFVTMPNEMQLSQAVGFAQRHAGGRILIHCQAGKCRSPAVALAILAAHDGPGREAESISALLEIRGESLPNLAALDVADRLLGRDGALIAAWAAVEDASPALVERRAAKTDQFARYLVNKARREDEASFSPRAP